MKPTLPIILCLSVSPAIAGETRELDAHVHGVGQLNMALDGKTVAMELHAPGADIVGFEYAAKSAEDRDTVAAALELLKTPLDLFTLPAAAGCSVVDASAKLEGDGQHDNHDHDEEHAHDEHGDDHHDHDEEHGHEEEHDDGHGDAEVNHTEFHAEYTLTCDNPTALGTMDFAYFAVFENALELEVQIVSPSGAQAFEVKRESPVLDLSGMF